MQGKQKLAILIFVVPLVAFSVIGLFSEGFVRAQVTYADYWVVVDEHDRPLPDSWYYNAVGGDRGMLNVDDVSYSRNGDSIYIARVIKKSGSWTWGGMWYSLVRIKRDNISLNFKAIFGPYIKPAFQGEITEAEIVVSNVNSPLNNANFELRLELKDVNDRKVFEKSWTNLIQTGYPKSYTVELDASKIGDVQLMLWVIDKAQVGDSLSIDRIRLKARVPNLPSEEQAFCWTYSWLMANYDPQTGMVQDRSNFGLGDFENVPATAKTAKVTGYAYKKGYVIYEDAKAIITKIADTLINVVPRGPEGVNTIWPHFTMNGGKQIVFNTEWASGDTIYATLDMIAALQMLGDPQNQISHFLDFLQGINWTALLLEDGSISHGYRYEGNLLPYSWKGFGMETIGVNWAYTAATGKVPIMVPPPSDNGAGFIDNAQYPMVFSGIDRWGNDWDTYRCYQADKQIGWYSTQDHYNKYLCDAGLFGLSAAENPEGNSYVAYGVGGRYTGPEDGNGEVIALHYSAMIVDIGPTEAKHVWDILRDRNAEFLQDRVVISPLNNLESMRVDKNTGKCTVNHLKGSWNLALQAEGWALTNSDVRNDLKVAIKNNAFLKKGYILIHMDDIPPEIGDPIQDPPPDDVQPFQNVTVAVNVTDDETGICNATLWYSLNSGADWISRNLTEISPNTYQATIDGYQNCTWITYKMVAYDNAGNNATKDNNGYGYRYHVMPEFPTATILPLLIIVSTLITVITRKQSTREKTQHQKHRSFCRLAFLRIA